jgi:hypothetical protein
MKAQPCKKQFRAISNALSADEIVVDEEEPFDITLRCPT